MEATSDYWKPVFYLLEAHGLEPWLVNARVVKHLPGRPKTDELDSVWLCKVAERQMLRPSFVPPAPIRRLRDLTRYRIDLVGTRTAEKNRVEKLLAQLARSCMRRKLSELEEAFTGLFDDHHAFLLARMLARIDGIDADIAAVDEQIEAQLAPFAAAERLDQIPGIGSVAAAIVLAEIGVDMTRFRPRGTCVLLGEVLPGHQLLSRENQGQRFDRARQQLSRPGLGRGRRRGRPNGYLPG